MEPKCSDKNVSEKTDINILLLSDTGFKKSLFINSIVNYLYRDIKKAKKEHLLYLTPCTFDINDSRNRTHKISLVFNDFKQVDLQSTQDVKTFVFPIENGRKILKLIDSPGIGDPRGVDQDNISCDRILSYIGQLHELHAICFLFKPNDSKIKSTVEYWGKQIMSSLAKSALENIIFIFTYTKETRYKLREAINYLKRAVKEIHEQSPKIDIKVDQNLFCFDDEAFRYLASVKHGVVFRKHTEEEYLKSWKISSEEGLKLIKYINGDGTHEPLKPYFVRDSTTINEARRVINELGQPLIDILQLILDNLRVLDRRELELKHHNLSYEKLKPKLYVPMINLRVIELTQPATICCYEKCVECVLIDEVKTWNYKQKCHNPCYLTNFPQEILGAPQLKDCTSMDRVTQKCLRCLCNLTDHMHIYYITEKFDDKKIDKAILSRINTSDDALAESGRVINEIEKRKKEIEKEKEAVITCVAKFVSFLQKNALTPFNDVYSNYLNYMVSRESNLENNADLILLHHFENTLKTYTKMKQALVKLVDSYPLERLSFIELNAKNVSEELMKLYALKHYGNKIKELNMSQINSRKKEFEKNEYFHSFYPLNQTDQKYQRQSDVERNYTKKGYHEKHKNFKQGKSNKSAKTYSNKETKKDFVETNVSGATGSNEQIKTEMNTNRKSNPQCRSTSNNKFSFDPNVNYSDAYSGKNKVSAPGGDPPTYSSRSYSKNRPPFGSRLSFAKDLHSGKHISGDNEPYHDNLSHNNPLPLNNTSCRNDDTSTKNYFLGCNLLSFINGTNVGNQPPFDSRSYYGQPFSLINNRIDDSHAHYNIRPPHPVRPLLSHSSSYDNSQSYDNRLLYTNQTSYANQLSYNNQTPYDHRLYNNQASYDNRLLYNNQIFYDNRLLYSNQSMHDNRHSLDNQPPHDQLPPHHNLPPHDNRPPQDNRPFYDNRPLHDNRQSHENRPPNDKLTYFANRPYVSERSRYHNYTFHEHRPSYDHQQSYNELRYDQTSNIAVDRSYFQGTSSEYRNYGTSPTSYAGRHDELVGATSSNYMRYYDNDKQLTSPAVSLENREMNAQDNKQPKPNRDRSRPKYAEEK